MYTKDMLARAKDFAQLLLTDSDLADILGLSLAQVRVALSTPSDELGVAIRSGRAITKAGLHKSLIDLAMRGSSPAQTAVAALLKAIGA